MFLPKLLFKLETNVFNTKIELRKNLLMTTIKKFLIDQILFILATWKKRNLENEKNAKFCDFRDF